LIFQRLGPTTLWLLCGVWGLVLAAGYTLYGRWQHLDDAPEPEG
jgi:hypothetical protein